MEKGRKIFLGFTVVFLMFLFFASYDIARRTTFPGSKGQLKERLRENYLKKDTISADSAKLRH
jgi:hypothetical protein